MGRNLVIFSKREYNLKIFKIENGNGVNFKPDIWHFPLISINDAKFITVDKKNADNNLEIYNLKIFKEEFILFMYKNSYL